MLSEPKMCLWTQLPEYQWDNISSIAASRRFTHHRPRNGRQMAKATHRTSDLPGHRGQISQKRFKTGNRADQSRRFLAVQPVKNKFWFAFSETNLVRLGSSASRHSPARRTIKQSRQQRLEVVPHRHRRVFGRQTNLLSDSSVSSQGSAEDAKPKSDVPAG